eukprot:1203678-Prorocentrum_lima.AAC.1
MTDADLRPSALALTMADCTKWAVTGSRSASRGDRTGGSCRLLADCFRISSLSAVYCSMR